MKAKDEEELWEKIQEIWNTKVSEKLPNFINSLPNRVEMVIQAKGGNTKY